MKKPKYDVIGYWSELKLDIIREYLYFASPNKTGASIVNDIFKKYREKGLR